MSDAPFGILFLCTANSARSILSEYALNDLAGPGSGVRAYSAGSHPKAAPNPIALALLAREGMDVSGARSKGWEVFSEPGAPRIDLVLTVCDAAAGESCPLYPGSPVKAHWGVPDPHTEADFERAYRVLRERCARLLALGPATLGREALSAAAAQLGRPA